MIRSPAAHGVEHVVTRLHRLEERGKPAADGHARRGFETGNPGIERRGIVDGKRLVRPPRREDAGDGIGARRQALVGIERIHGIVSRANDRHTECAQQAHRRESVFVQTFVGPIEDRPRRRRRQPCPNAKRTPEFHVRPVVERVPQRVRHRPRPRLELLPVGGVAGAETLRHAIRPHRPPLVVIAVQPDLRDRSEPMIGRHLVGRQMTVVIDDRHVRGVSVVEIRRDVTFEKEVGIEEWFHDRAAPEGRPAPAGTTGRPDADDS